MKYAIIGFPKCGTVSLEEYLKRDKKNEVIRVVPEIAWLPNAHRTYKAYYSEYTPVLITRDPFDRLWSAYRFYTFFHGVTWEEFLNGNDPRYHFIGCSKIKGKWDYTPHINRFAEWNPLVFSLEEMQKRPDFPHNNKTDREEMPLQFRQMVEAYIGL